MNREAINCGGCTRCCKYDNIFLLPNEMERLQWHYEGGRPVLDKKPNGECIYLTPSGCGNYEERPSICKRFRCDEWYASKSKTERKELIRQNPNNRLVLAKGKKMWRILNAASVRPK